MATTSNYDSAGLSTGKDITELYTTVDYLLTANVINLLGSKVTDTITPNQWMLDVFQGIAGLNKQNDIIIKKAYQKAVSIIDSDVGESYNAGITEVNRQASELGLKTSQETPKIANSTNAREQRENAIQALKQASIVAKRQASSNAFAIASAVGLVATVGNIKEAIDQHAQKYIFKGNVGKVKSNGEQMSLAGYIAGVTREASHKSYLSASGETRAAYGLNLVLISTHASSCEKCRPYEGKVLIDDRFGGGQKYGNYTLLSEAIEKGLFHFNCRHGMTIYKQGMKKPEPPKNNPETLKKKKLTYDIEQKQRQQQRDIRSWKKVKANAQTGAQKTKATAIIRSKQANLRGLEKVAKSNGVPFYRQNWKEQEVFEFDTFKPELARL